MLRKIQGNDLKVECEDGVVNISSIYGGDVLINTRRGNVTVGDVHGKILNHHHHQWHSQGHIVLGGQNVSAEGASHFRGVRGMLSRKILKFRVLQM